MDHRFRRGETAFMLGVPAAWAILLLFHPTGDGDYYPIVKDDVTAWLAVHIGMMIFVPLFAAAVLLLIRGVESTGASVARIALPIFAVFYIAWEAVLGIGTGILADEINALPADERPAGAELLQDYADNVLLSNPGILGMAGTLALLTGMLAAGLALVRHAGASRWAPVLLAVSALLLSAHPPPFGPVGLALFIAAVALVVRGRAATRPSELDLRGERTAPGGIASAAR